MAKEKYPSEEPSSALIPRKMVPKFCTAINISVMNNRNVIMTLLYAEGNDDLALIDRIVIDIDHAKSLHKTLGQMLQEAENANGTSGR